MPRDGSNAGTARDRIAAGAVERSQRRAVPRWMARAPPAALGWALAWGSGRGWWGGGGALGGPGVRERRRADDLLRDRHRAACRRDVAWHLGPRHQFPAPGVLLGRHARLPGLGSRAWGRRARLPPGHPSPVPGVRPLARSSYGARTPGPVVS